MAALDATGRIERRSLHEQLIDRLRSMLVEGDIAPGEKIAEKALCAAFDVSRTPLREALKVLAREGLVILTPNRGATAAPLTRADLDEVFPVMGALEALAGELAAARATDAEIAGIENAHQAMRRHFETGDRPPYFAANQQIHDAIVKAARNPTLVEMQKTLSGRIRRARYAANIAPDRWAEAMEEHEEILAALKARDGARLSAILKLHLEHKLTAVSAALTV